MRMNDHKLRIQAPHDNARSQCVLNQIIFQLHLLFSLGISFDIAPVPYDARRRQRRRDLRDQSVVADARSPQPWNLEKDVEHREDRGGQDNDNCDSVTDQTVQCIITASPAA